MNMDSLDTGLTLDSLVFAIDAIQPYVLGWPLGEELDGEAEATVLRGRSSFSFAFSFPSSSCHRSWKLWRRRDFWTVSFGQRTSCHLRRRYSLTDNSGCYDHRLHSRCPAPHERVSTARGPRLQLRRGFPICLSSHRCAFAKDPCMTSKLTRVTSRLLHARRARGGGVSPSRSQAAKKKSCRKGYAYRRWTKAQATNYGVTGVRHAGPFVDPSQDHRAVVTDLREASGVGEPHPPAWEGTCHRIGSVTCKQLERSTTTSLGADAHSQTPSKDSAEDGPWFVGFSRSFTDKGGGGARIRTAGGIGSVCPDLRSCASPGSAGPEQGPYHFGSTDSQCAIRPHGQKGRPTHRNTSCSI